VCSNYTIEDCYHTAVEKDMTAIAPLTARFRVLKFNGRNQQIENERPKSRSRERE
jgi:hypothetical protein